jgi:single-stranded-DNA-specific exonuclease
MRWIERPPGAEQCTAQLHDSLNQNPKKPVAYWLSQLLVSRHIETYDEAEEFFVPRLEAVHDPFLMQDMDKAVARIEQALQQGETILVYGDYDVDGTTAVALMYEYLTGRGGTCASYIPDRYSEGYGLSEQGIRFADDNDFSLIVALDCGVKAFDSIALAAELGIDVIVCDHHMPEPHLPKAFAVLDPMRPDCNYPFKDLCGCGVGFKLAQALEQSAGRGLDRLIPFLDLVAIAIGADVVSVAGENRILAYHGVEQIKLNPRPAIKALLGSKSVVDAHLSDFNFSIAPKINAAGRIKHGEYAVALLTTKEGEKARQLTLEIEEFNKERRSTEQQVTEEALKLVKAEGDRYATVVRAPHWHKGVIGIVASRLQATYYRPTIVFTQSGAEWAASARSVKGYDIHAAIEACQQHLIQFGGHAYAAGITLSEDQYEPFKAAFEAHVRQTLKPEQQEPSITYDIEIVLEMLDMKTFRLLQRFQPFGPDNAEPIFLLRGMRLSDLQCVGAEGAHLKGRLGYLPFIAFRMGQLLEMAKASMVDVLVTLSMNHFNEKASLQLQLKDMRPSD